mgnify:CR=1 FL=1
MRGRGVGILVRVIVAGMRAPPGGGCGRSY